MLGQMRGKIGAWVVGGIIGFIAFVFIFEGVFRPRSTQGLHEGSVAGTVNGESISIGEFNRAYERRMQYFKGFGGDKMSEEQLKMFRIREGAFIELAQQKLVSQDAVKQGFLPSDEQMRREIVKIPAFQKDGKFDPITYKRVLEANRFTVGLFEKSMRDQLASEAWMKYLASLSKVSEAEVRSEFEGQEDKRNVKVVELTPDAPKKGDLTPRDLAKKVASMMKAGKGSDAAINALVKPYGASVRETGLFSKSSQYIPGLGEDATLLKAVFEDPSLTSSAKVFEVPGRLVIALVTDSKKPNWAEFEKKKSQQMSQVRTRKERAIFDATLKQLMKKASIDSNPAVVGEIDPKEFDRS